jgi:DsbC/DsbD-like thiol-disulfide interchange protein
VAAISYDSVALLKEFAERKRITYPLLSDSESKIIRAFGILNDNFPPDHPWHGVPFPGTYVVNEQGVIIEKYFEEDHRERYTASAVLVKHSGQGQDSGWTEVQTQHLKLRYSSSDKIVRAGNRVVLLLEVELSPRMHVYAPGVRGGYIPIEWKVKPSPGWLAHSASYPASRTLHLPAIGETVPVFEGQFRVTRDLTIGQDSDIKPFLRDNQHLTVEGAFHYQACDDRVCYPSQTVPLKWMLVVDAHDTNRATKKVQRHGPRP